VLLFPALALAQSNPDSRGGAAVCPLSEEQTQQSIDTFDKFVPILTNEPRCTNCHGGVNPFIDGVGDPADPTASRFEHGGGQMDKFVAAVPATANSPAIPGSVQSDCSVCHNDLAPKHPSGEPSVWKVAPDFLSFLGKDAPTLCEQIKDFSRRCEGGICGPWPDAEKFIGHVTNDEGHDNFTATAFAGMRGLNAAENPEIKPEPPVGTTGGKFQGDNSCGCRPAEYAIRISAATQMNRGGITFASALAPLDIPITFADDGTFTGAGVGVFRSTSDVMTICTGQSATSLDFKLTGKAIQNVDEQSLHLRIETNTAATTLNAQCLPVTITTQNTTAQQTVMEFDFVGDVNEFTDRVMAPPVPGFTSSARVQLVRLK
jgi:hypothetical protein